jgi:hypothetical protein
LHQTETALPSRIFTRNVAGLFDHLVGELLELQGDVGAKPLAVLKLTTSSNLVGACTGRLAGFSPLRMPDALLARPGFAFGGCINVPP